MRNKQNIPKLKRKIFIKVKVSIKKKKKKVSSLNSHVSKILK